MTDEGLQTPPPAQLKGGAFDGQHPELRKVCVVNCQTKTRIVPNSVPDKLDNECFTGEVLLLLRTPDVDDPKARTKDMGEMPCKVRYAAAGPHIGK